MSNLSITSQWNDEINQVEPGELISAEQMYRNAAAVHLFIDFKGMLKIKKADVVKW